MKPVIHINQTSATGIAGFTVSCPEYDISATGECLTDAYVELLPQLYRCILADERQLEEDQIEKT